MSRYQQIRELANLHERLSSCFSYRNLVHFQCNNYSQDINNVLYEFIFEKLQNIKARTREEIINGKADCAKSYFDSLKCWSILLQKPKRRFSLINYEYKWNDSTFNWILPQENEFTVQGVMSIVDKNKNELKTSSNLLCFEIVIKLEVIE
jgi:hypothetical protein